MNAKASKVLRKEINKKVADFVSGKVNEELILRRRQLFLTRMVAAALAFGCVTGFGVALAVVIK